VINPPSLFEGLQRNKGEKFYDRTHSNLFFKSHGTWAAAGSTQLTESAFLNQANAILQTGVERGQDVDYITDRIHGLITANPDIATKNHLPTDTPTIKTKIVQPLVEKFAHLQLTEKNHGWFRPAGHEYVVGRDGFFKNHTLNNLFRPGSGIVKNIDDNFPAGHTFGTNHDAFVEYMTTQLHVPDTLVNIPSMSGIYSISFFQELNNSISELSNKIFDTNFYIYGH
jgi:hypothetical protein